MSSVLRHARLLAATTLLAAMPLGAAWAQNVDAALDRLKAMVEEQGTKIEWASADITGADAVLVDVTVGTAEQMVPIGNVTLSGISDTDTGYLVNSIAMDRYFVDDGAGSTVTVEGVEMTGVVIPNEGEEDAYGGFVFYETADVGAVNVTTMGKEVFTLADMHFEVTKPEGGNPMDFAGAAESFTIDLSVIEDPQQKQILQALGYEQLEGYMELAGSWQPEDGRMSLSQYDLAIVDAGTIGFTFDLGGYTPDFIASLRELQQQMAASPDGDNSAQGLAIMGLMQQLTFHGADISFSDDSLTNKVLEFVAQMQGMKASDIANQAKAVLPFALAQLNNPELTSQASQAVSAYLDNPQTLRIVAEPAEPVPFALIMAGAMSDPMSLTKTLAVGVYANE
jgi:hypothetical protein